MHDTVKSVAPAFRTSKNDSSAMQAEASSENASQRSICHRITHLICAGLSILMLASCGNSSPMAKPSVAPTKSTVRSGGSLGMPFPNAEHLPITSSNELSSDGQDASILLPTSCTLQDGVLSATGTFRLQLSESYVRSGDVVELYAYTSPDSSNSALQVVNLMNEHPSIMDRNGTWQVSGPVDSKIGPPAKCMVAIQSTHAFMTAGSAGG